MRSGKNQFPVPPDITGHKFGSWTVLRRGEKKNQVWRWVCRCDCGTVSGVGYRHLIKGNSTKCGKCAGKSVSTKRLVKRTATSGKFLRKSGICNRNRGWANVRQEQFDSQKGICPVCDKPLLADPSTWAWDHDHITDECRELLHRGCNVLIGRIENDPLVLERATNYLKKHGSPHV